MVRPEHKTANKIIERKKLSTKFSGIIVRAKLIRVPTHKTPNNYVIYIQFDKIKEVVAKR